MHSKRGLALKPDLFIVKKLFPVWVAVTGFTVFFAMGISSMARHTCSYYFSRLVLRHEGAISLGV